MMWDVGGSTCPGTGFQQLGLYMEFGFGYCRVVLLFAFMSLGFVLLGCFTSCRRGLHRSQSVRLETVPSIPTAAVLI